MNTKKILRELKKEIGFYKVYKPYIFNSGEIRIKSENRNQLFTQFFIKDLMKITQYYNLVFGVFKGEIYISEDL